MNRTVIEWTIFTWNFLVGCLFGCPYCYARRMARRHVHDCEKCGSFEPHIHPERLDAPKRVKKPALIFVCSMGELFGGWVPKKWIEAVLQVTRECPQHVFQFLTKWPKRLAEFEFDHNCWVGTSIDYRNNLWRLDAVRKARAPVRFVSFEPLLSDMGEPNLAGIDWVIIGAQTGPGAVKPDQAWVRGIIRAARRSSVPLFIKDNVRWPETIREWPKGYENHEACLAATKKWSRRKAGAGHRGCRNT